MTEDTAERDAADAGASDHRCVCGKRAYRTFGAAKRAMNSMKQYRRDRADEGVLRPYRCEQRRHVWHVGHGEV